MSFGGPFTATMVRERAPPREDRWRRDGGGCVNVGPGACAPRHATSSSHRTGVLRSDDMPDERQRCSASSAAGSCRVRRRRISVTHPGPGASGHMSGPTGVPATTRGEQLCSSIKRKVAREGLRNGC